MRSLTRIGPLSIAFLLRYTALIITRRDVNRVIAGVLLPVQIYSPRKPVQSLPPSAEAVRSKRPQPIWPWRPDAVSGNAGNWNRDDPFISKLYKNYVCCFLTSVLIWCNGLIPVAQHHPSKAAAIDQKVKAQITADTAVLEDAIVHGKIGSVLKVLPGKLRKAGQWNSYMAKVCALSQKTRLKIPVLYGLDDIHGLNYVDGATLFPQQIGQAATFDPSLVKKAAEITAYEARAARFLPSTSKALSPLGYPNMIIG